MKQGAKALVKRVKAFGRRKLFVHIFFKDLQDVDVKVGAAGIGESGKICLGTAAARKFLCILGGEVGYAGEETGLYGLFVVKRRLTAAREDTL